MPGAGYEPRAGGPDDESSLAGAGDRSASVSVFQVLGPDDDVAGTGFLVQEGTGFTCAHVVRAAGRSPGDQLEVVFPQLPDAPRVSAEVVAEEWGAPEAEDVAVLRLDAVPAGARGMAVGTSAGSWRHRVFSFGFPAQAPRGGHFGYAGVGGLLPGDDGGGRLLQLSEANDLTTGFSGGPVVDELTGLVIGMVTSIAAPDAHLKGLSIAYATPAEVLREIRPQLAEHQACPYLGLEPFTAQHADWFHGREAAVERALAALDGNRRMLMLLGPSGAGKSSLINAGVLPALSEGALPGSDRWLCLRAQPGQDLLTELVRAGLPGAATDGLPAAVESRLAADPDHDRLLLVIDQFEELLTQSSGLSPHQRSDTGSLRAAVDQLLELGGSHTDASVLLVMRNDFYAPLDALAPDLMNAVLPGLCNVPATLSRPDIQAIITRPAAAVGLPLETGLADRIVNDVLDINPVARQAPVTLLPPLELALRRLWLRRRREDGHLTHAAYENIGKVTGSLTAWCNRALGQLPAAQHPTARRILVALVRPADEAHGIPATRRPVPLSRLRALAVDPGLTGPAADTAFDAVLAALTRYRIVTTGTTAPPGTPDGEPAAELIHDALIRGWADLRDWVAQDHQFQLWLLRAAEQQARHEHSGLPGDLLVGSLLAEGEEWARQRALPAEITELLRASSRHQRSAARRTRRINTALAGMLVLALIATGIAIHQGQTVAGQRDRAASAQVADDARSVRRDDPELARRLAVASAGLADTPESWSSLLAVSNQREDDARKLTGFTATESDLDSRGRTLMAAADTRVEFWNVRSRQRTGSYTAPAKVHQVDLSDDGKTAALSTDDGYTRMLDVSTARLLNAHTYRTAKQDSGYWPDTAVSPRGTYLRVGTISSDMKSTMVIHNTRTGRKHMSTSLRGPGSLMGDTSFSPDEKVLSVPGGHGKPFTWFSLRTKKKIRVPFRYTGLKADDIQGPVTFSPDGRRAALTTKDGSISVFDRATGWPDVELEGGEKYTDHPVYFSHDSRYIVQNAVVWDTSRTQLDPVMRHSTTQSECHPTTALRFTTDDKKLRCAGTDGVVRSFDVSTFTKPPRTHEAYSEGAAVSADRRTLALSNDGGIDIWSPLSRTKRSTLSRGEDRVEPSIEKTRLGRNGRLLAVLAGPRIEIWDTSKKKGALVGRLPLADEDPRFSGTAEFAFSPDNKSLAVQVLGEDETHVLTFWDLTTERRIGEVRGKPGAEHGDGDSVLFHPDGRSVTAAPDIGRIEFPSGRVLAKGSSGMAADSISDDGSTLYAHPRGFLPYVRFRDARTLRTSGEDLRTGSISPPLLEPGKGTVVSPDGRLFATMSQSGHTDRIKLWDTRTRSQTGLPLTGPVNEVVAITFAHDGSALISVDQQGRFFTHTIDPERLVRKLCAKSGPLTKQEWKTHIPDVPYRETC